MWWSQWGVWVPHWQQWQVPHWQQWVPHWQQWVPHWQQWQVPWQVPHWQQWQWQPVAAAPAAADAVANVAAAPAQWKAGPWANFRRGQGKAPQQPKASPPGRGSKRARRTYKRNQKYLVQARMAFLRVYHEHLTDRTRVLRVGWPWL